MTDLDDKIALATRHVDEGRRIVEQQRERIAIGGAGTRAVELLRNFEQSLDIFETDLVRLMEERDKLAGERACSRVLTRSATASSRSLNSATKARASIAVRHTHQV